MNENDYNPDWAPIAWAHRQRDIFATHALSGIMAKMASTTMPAGTRDALAKLAYQMADAMLVAREKSEAAQ